MVLPITFSGAFSLSELKNIVIVHFTNNRKSIKKECCRLYTHNSFLYQFLFYNVHLSKYSHLFGTSSTTCYYFDVIRSNTIFYNLNNKPSHPYMFALLYHNKGKQDVHQYTKVGLLVDNQEYLHLPLQL